MRLSDLPEYEREHLLAKDLKPLGPPAWTPLSKPVSELRVALIATAGLHARDDPGFDFTDATFRQAGHLGRTVLVPREAVGEATAGVGNRAALSSSR